MGDTKLVVDHLKLEYQGVFSVRDLFRMFTRWCKERAYEKGGDYISEQNTENGKYIEYFYYPWKKDTSEVRFFMKIRLLIYDLKKVDMMVDEEKKRLDHGKVILYLDGFLEFDYDVRWQHQPLWIFLRTIFNKYVFSRYHSSFEKIIIDDTHDLYEHFERFFNMYHSFKRPKSAPYF